MTELPLTIRSIQHYMYCPRRFGLLELNCDWVENVSVIAANLMHEHVHEGSHSFSTRDKIVNSAVSVYCDDSDYNIYGVTDCIEFIRSRNGFRLSGHVGSYTARIVEYKPTKPKNTDYNESDAIQVFAQKICVDSIWQGDSEAYIYYSDVKRRVKLPFDADFERYDAMLKELLLGMREVLESGRVPAKKRSQKCSGCSLKDCCIPNKATLSVRDMITAEFKEDICESY